MIGLPAPPDRARAGRFALVLLALAVATWQRGRAVALLPPDFDELPYLHAAFRYAERTTPGLPWYHQVVWLFQAAPTRWHPGVFPLGRVTMVLLPLAAVGLPLTFRRRPVFAWAAVVGFAFLLVWPVKWPQYLMLVLLPLAVSAAHAPAALAGAFRHLRSGRAAAAA